jgi:hypothetical protein
VSLINQLLNTHDLKTNADFRRDKQARLKFRSEIIRFSSILWSCSQDEWKIISRTKRTYDEKIINKCKRDIYCFYTEKNSAVATIPKSTFMEWISIGVGNAVFVRYHLREPTSSTLVLPVAGDAVSWRSWAISVEIFCKEVDRRHKLAIKDGEVELCDDLIRRSEMQYSNLSRSLSKHHPMLDEAEHEIFCSISQIFFNKMREFLNEFDSIINFSELESKNFSIDSPLVNFLRNELCGHVDQSHIELCVAVFKLAYSKPNSE